MKFWLPILNSLALSFVTVRVIAWAKQRWGLQDPPKWALSILPIAAIIYGAYQDFMGVLETLGYMVFTLAIIGAMFLLPYRRHE